MQFVVGENRAADSVQSYLKFWSELKKKVKWKSSAVIRLEEANKAEGHKPGNAYHWRWQRSAEATAAQTEAAVPMRKPKPNTGLLI